MIFKLKSICWNFFDRGKGSNNDKIRYDTQAVIFTLGFKSELFHGRHIHYTPRILIIVYFSIASYKPKTFNSEKKYIRLIFKFFDIYDLIIII